MGRRRRRGLTPEDQAHWAEVAARVKPLSDRPSAPPDPVSPPPVAPRARPAVLAPHPEVPPDFRVGAWSRPSTAAHDLAPGLSDRLAAQTPRVHGKTARRMKQGKLSPQARLDLHGMTLAQAHPALTRFVTRAHQDGLRLVLVITGKGKDRDTDGPVPVPRGVLRHQVPHWLTQHPLRQIVLEIRSAHLRHGGEGAYYVYLRRTR